MACAAADSVEAVMKAAVRTTRRVARVLMERLEREGLLFKRPELTGWECITMDPPTTVLLPDFRRLPHAEDRQANGSQGLLVTDGQDDRGGLSGCRKADAGGSNVNCVGLERGARTAAPCQS